MEISTSYIHQRDLNLFHIQRTQPPPKCSSLVGKRESLRTECFTFQVNQATKLVVTFVGGRRGAVCGRI